MQNTTTFETKERYIFLSIFLTTENGKRHEFDAILDTGAPRTEFFNMKSVKVKSGNSLTEYLKTKLWFENDSSTQLDVHPVYSSHSLNIQFVDILCNCIWRSYEYKDQTFVNVLSKNLNLKPLFF
ncbi:MAG: DUF3800 domain-containing protein [Pseudomonadota bacterium]